ncbi:Protein OS-9 [Tulasnella sp. 418]|nr:Protein OS-9 [Tulasnella sp. 418]
MLGPILTLALLFAGDVQGRIRYSSIPEDTFAFPKLRVNFLNNIPLASDTAEKWLSEGLKGGVMEFLGDEASKYLQDWPQIDDGAGDSGQKGHEPRLKRMRFGRERSFACLIPPASPETHNPELDASAPEQSVDPLKSWALLQPLTDTCLYHKQGWFTYAYCHNSYVRQFKEIESNQPHSPGGRIPKEDTDYEAYILGRAPELIGHGDGELALRNDRHRHADALQLAQGRDQRYLTSKWLDGTVCDKTGRPREIEIQFHCGMTTTDAIQFIKETSLCKYLLVIHSPRLCGEPGFKSSREFQVAAPIQCREILKEEGLLGKGTTQEVQTGNDQTPYPPQTHLRNPAHLPNLAAQQAKKATVKAEKINLPSPGDKSKHAESVEKIITQLIAEQWDALGGGGELRFDEDGGLTIKGDNGNDFVVQLLDLDGDEGLGGDRQEILERLQKSLNQFRRDEHEDDKKNKKKQKGKAPPPPQQDNNAREGRNNDREEDWGDDWEL